MSREKYFPVLGAASVLIVITILSISILSKAKADKNQYIPPGTPYPTYIGPIQSFQTQLYSTDISNIERTQIQIKLNAIYKMSTQRVEVLVPPPTRQATYSPPTSGAIGHRRPDGINNTPSAPFSRMVFTPLNSWLKTITDSYYLIYFGYLTQDPEQGAVYVFNRNPNDYSLYLTPERHGAVKAISENGTIITLEATDGTLFYFNASTEQFSNEHGTPLPSTPTPFNSSTSTPIPYP